MDDSDAIFEAEYERRDYREMCELFGFDITPPGTPEEPAAAPAPAPAAPPAQFAPQHAEAIESLCAMGAPPPRNSERNSGANLAQAL